MTGRLTAGFAIDPEVFGHVFDSSALNRLAAAVDVVSLDPLDPLDDRWRASLRELDVLITGWGAPVLNAATLGMAPRLRAIVHSAGSVKGFTTEAVWERDIAVSSLAWVNALPVAEYTLAAILAWNKALPRIERDYKALRSRWHWTDAGLEMGNYRRTIGVVGASNVGRRLLEMLAVHDFDVLLADTYVGAAEAAALGARKVELDELCRSSDVVTLHAPALPSTHHMIDAARLASMPDGATLINTARGSLVDQAALEAELVTGRINAVLDTTEPYFLPDESPLYDLPNVALTPHVAGSLGNELRRLGHAAVDEVERFASDTPLRYPVRAGLLARQA